MNKNDMTRPKRAVFIQRAGLVLLAVTCAGVLTGCGTLGVKPWERDQLAKRSMRPVTHPVIANMQNHIDYSKEASTGGQNASGGGCGCN